MKPHLQEYIDEFNSGDIEGLQSIFGDMENILTFFQKQNVLHLIDPFDSDLDDYQLEILNFLLNKSNDKTIMKKIVDLFADVVIKEDGYYLKLSDKSDLSELFKTYSRDVGPSDIVKSLFNDDNWEHFSNTTDDIYDDVIEVLTPENIELLKTHILDTLTNWKIEIDDDSPDLFRDYSDDEGVFYLTPENVNTIIGDKESFMYLLDNDYLPDVTGDLHSVHYNAYNQAYESEIYDDVMSELETFFDVKTGKWITEPNSVNPELLREFYTIKFNPNEVVNSVKKYIGDTNNWGYYNNNIDYIGTWLSLMDILMDSGQEDYLDFRIPDYADWTLTKKYINEIFPDYI
jgi:hypothetical protein